MLSLWLEWRNVPGSACGSGARSDYIQRVGLWAFLWWGQTVKSLRRTQLLIGSRSRIMRHPQACISFIQATSFIQLWTDQSGNHHYVVFIIRVCSLTFLRHLSPLRVGELILAHPDPAFHPWRDGLARVGVKRREATQPANAILVLSTHNHIYCTVLQHVLLRVYSQDIHDDTQRPHVAWLVIFLWPQNLGSLSATSKISQKRNAIVNEIHFYWQNI